MSYNADKFMALMDSACGPYKARTTLLNLPLECMHSIMRFLRTCDLARLMCTCQTLYKHSDQSVHSFLEAILNSLPIWKHMRYHHPNTLTAERLDKMSLTAIESYINWHGFSLHNVLERAGLLNANHPVKVQWLKQWLRGTCELENPSIMNQPLRKLERVMLQDFDRMQLSCSADSIVMYASQVPMIAGKAAMVLRLPDDAPLNSYIDIGVMRHQYDANVTMVPWRAKTLQEVVNRFGFSICRSGSQARISGISRVTLRRTPTWELGSTSLSGRDKRGPAEELHISERVKFDTGGNVALVLDIDAGTLSLYKNGANCGVVDSGLWGAYKFVVVMPKEAQHEVMCGAKADAYMLEHCGEHWAQ